MRSVYEGVLPLPSPVPFEERRRIRERAGRAAALQSLQALRARSRRRRLALRVVRAAAGPLAGLIVGFLAARLGR